MWERARNVDSLNLGQPMVVDAGLKTNLKAAVLDSFGFLPQKQKGLCGWELFRPASQERLGSRVFQSVTGAKVKNPARASTGAVGVQWGGRWAS